jgi:predicted Zn finger-like uncharacterized protein
MYTQCPSCRTMFRISEQQLAIAKGKVRCGKCNHIYNAQGTLIDELPQQAPNTPKPAAKDKDDFDLVRSTEVPADINIAPGQTTEDDDDWLFGEDSEFGSDALQDDDIPSVTPTSGIGDNDLHMDNLGSGSDIKTTQYDDEDDDWLFGDEDDDIDIILRDEGDQVPETVTPQPDESEEEDSDFMHHMSDYLDEDRANEIISDESASDILDELNEQLAFTIDNPEQKQQARQGINLPGDWDDDFEKVIESTSFDLSEEDRERQEINDAILNNLDLSPTPAPTPAPEVEKPSAFKLETDPANNNPFDDQESIVLEAPPENDSGHKIGQHDEVPLRIRDSIGIEEEEARTGLNWLGMIGGTIALIFILVAQLILFRSPDLANMYPDMQPTLLSLCENLPCRDSRKYDAHGIELMSRNISQHPKTKSALLIKAAIINRANFTQRYPKIQITLSDVTGDTVAQRIFYPQEYLGKLYHPFLTMKSNTPVHIALEVMDPGSAAINFEFKFL